VNKLARFSWGAEPSDGRETRKRNFFREVHGARDAHHRRVRRVAAVVDRAIGEDGDDEGAAKRGHPSTHKTIDARPDTNVAIALQR
jgi:hypothetical protein